MTVHFSEYTPEDVQRELFELIVKAGRRCAYDLDHASGQIADPELRVLFESRAKHWLTVFAPDNGPKDYRHRLHNELAERQNKVEGLRALCKAHLIECGKYDDFPF